MTSKLRHTQTISDYVIQPNIISQAMYNLGPYARKLIAMAMSLMSPDEGVYTVSFKATDFIKAIGLEVKKQSTDTKNCIKAAVRECLDSHIEINKPNGDWEGYTWFTVSKLQNFKFEWDWGWDKIEMKFNPDLGDVIKAFKKAYAKIELADLGKLHSRYAIRFYELALSYAGFEGKDGNRRGEWYFDKTLADLRSLFMVGKSKYKITNEFKRNIIDKPIEEINIAGLGLRIEPEYVRRGNRLIGARFWCRWVKRGEPVSVNPATETGQEDEQIIATFPEEYQSYLKKAQKETADQPGLFQDYPEFQRLAAEGRAIAQLREAHPDFFKKSTKKDGKKV